jgi:beta-lactamase superfamily II metal-dependent hydrolase
MGQGDCTIMATPEGRVVMIDCGSDSTETKDKTVFTLRVASILRNAKFLRHSRLVDALILTHSDTDHYNHLKRVLPQNTKFQNIYHSDKRDTYSEAGTSAFLLSRAVSESRIFAVDHHMNRPAKTPVIRLNGVSVKPATGTEKINVLDGNGGIRIVNEPDCKISLLASNVNPPQPQDNSNPKNRGSIVTLVEVFGETLLMCGDATVATEKYVLDRHRARITDVTLAQAGHHGSARTSSSLDYVQCVNPELAIVSAGKAVVKDHLPSYTVIKRYTAQMTRAADIDEHEIFYWRCYGLSDGYGYESDITRRPIHVTGSWMTYYYTIKAPGGGA